MRLADIKGMVIGGKSVSRIATGGRVMWSKASEDVDDGVGLPSAYQAVAWIGNNPGTGNKAYLDLGFAFDTKARIEMGQYVHTLDTSYLFGAAEDDGKLRCMVTSPDSGNEQCILYGSTGSAYVPLTGTTLEQNAVNDLVFTLESGNLRSYNGTTDSEKTNTTQAAYTMTSHLYLLTQNYNGSPRFSGVSRVSYFRYYDKTDTLICDLVPCYRRVDGKVGMYDLVRRMFLVDASGGTKAFEKGDDVDWQ